jgi:heme/copper-type cytochrome/quinol oxidase subunit 2
MPFDDPPSSSYYQPFFRLLPMNENAPNPGEHTPPLKRKTLLAIIVLLVPAGVLIAAAIISSINEKAQFQSVKLPAIFLCAYTVAGLCSPFVGLSILWNLRRRAVAAPDASEQRKIERLRLLAAVTILAPAVWLVGFVYILFATGFSR